MYNPHTDLLLMAAFGLTLILVALIGARLDRKRKGWQCPPWLGTTTAGHYRALHGYRPEMPETPLRW